MPNLFKKNIKVKSTVDNEKTVNPITNINKIKIVKVVIGVDLLKKFAIIGNYSYFCPVNILKI